MGRLIDADDLCKKLREIYDGYMLDEGCCPIEFENMVDDMPTAYNVENVVEELEKESDFFGGKPMGSLQKMYYCKGIKKAIDIVKAGVINERT